MVNFAPGETTKTLDIPLINDSIKETLESFSISLSEVVGATQEVGLGRGKSWTTMSPASPGKFELTASQLPSPRTPANWS